MYGALVREPLLFLLSRCLFWETRTSAISLTAWTLFFLGSGRRNRLYADWRHCMLIHSSEWFRIKMIIWLYCLFIVKLVLWMLRGLMRVVARKSLEGARIEKFSAHAIVNSKLGWRHALKITANDVASRQKYVGNYGAQIYNRKGIEFTYLCKTWFIRYGSVSCRNENSINENRWSLKIRFSKHKNPTKTKSKTKTVAIKSIDNE